MKTIWTALSLTMGASGAGAQGLVDFADCAGRYSATVEHLWLFDGSAAEDAARRRDDFVDLVAALPGAEAAMARRVAAKAAQRGLWDRARFSGDARAGRLARDYLVACDSLLTGA